MRKVLVLLIATIALTASARTAPAQTIVETAPPFPLEATAPGIALSEGDQMIIGVRFGLTQSTRITSVTTAASAVFQNTSFYVAIVPVSSAASFPAGTPVTDAEVLAHRAVSLPYDGMLIRDRVAPFDLVLPPGNYMAIFGTGRFGTSGMATLFYSQTAGTLIAYQANQGMWFQNNLFPMIPRMVVSGTPEAPALCIAGQFRSSTGQCTPCAAGSFSTTADATACTLASAGSYVPAVGAISAQFCPAHTFSPAAGSTSCTACASGFSSGIGATACVAQVSCAAGTYIAGSSCAVCAPGTFSPQADAFACTIAPAGTYVPAFGANAAAPCPGGSFSLPGSAACNTCPAGTTSGIGASTCTPITCAAPQELNVETNTCACPAPPPGQRIVNAQTCQTASNENALTLTAVCTQPDPQNPTLRLVRFGYENTFASSAQVDVPYGMSNTVTVNGIDAGPASGAPQTLAPGIHTNAFSFRYSSGTAVVWSVRDPQSSAMVTASPSASTPDCAVQGAQGPQGPAGSPGAPGAQGLQGPQGPGGPAGNDGAAGPQGPQGERGADGAQGAAGKDGAQGPAGPQGPQGEVPAGTLILRFASEPAPAGYVLVGEVEMEVKTAVSGKKDKKSADRRVRLYRKQ